MLIVVIDLRFDVFGFGGHCLVALGYGGLLVGFVS